MTDLTKTVEDALEEYHKYRSDAVAKLISADEKSFKIVFIGHFCEVCGIKDEYALVLYLLEKRGLKAEVTDVKTSEDEFIASFKVVDQK